MYALEDAIDNAALTTRDERNLMPLAEATALLAATSEFRRGETRFVDGHAVLDSDRLWAALLSLEDVEAFNREASRLDWYFHVRNPGKAAAHERYGDGIIDWLETMLQPNNVFLAVPSAAPAHLIAIGTKRAFDLVDRVRDIEYRGDPPGGVPGPFSPDHPGDWDAMELPPPPEGGERYQQRGHAIMLQWISRHPHLGIPWLFERADPNATADPPRRAAFMAKNVLAANDDDWDTWHTLVEERSEAWAAERYAALGAERP